MGIRGPHIGKAVITKRHVEDALKFTALDHILLCRGAGANITGNVGTTYASLTGSYMGINPARYRGIIKVEAYFHWDPGSAAGGVRIFNTTDGTTLVASEPGVAGWRTDRIDITTTWKAITADKMFRAETKGDGTTPPTIAAILIIVECGNV